MAVAETHEPRVLIVDDEEPIADLYEHHLSERYGTRKAYGGEEAIEKVDEAVDVVLLDRRMPECPGDDVLTHIRENELNCQVVMVTAVTVSVDISDMDFDDYLSKPVDESTLVDAVEHQLSMSTYDETYRELNQLCAKIDALESEKTSVELGNNSEYMKLKQRVEELIDGKEELVEELEYFESTPPL